MPPGIVEPLLGDDFREVFVERQLVFRLLVVELNHMRQILDVPEGEIDGSRPNALRERIAPHAGKKPVEIAFRCRRDPAPQRCREQWSRREQCPAAHAERHHPHAPAAATLPPPRIATTPGYLQSHKEISRDSIMKPIRYRSRHQYRNISP